MPAGLTGPPAARVWHAVVKAADGGEKLFLQTLHRAQPRDLKVARARLKKIDRREERRRAGRNPRSRPKA